MSKQDAQSAAKTQINVEEFTCPPEKALEFLKDIVDKISTRFTKKYYEPKDLNSEENKDNYRISVDFFERRSKLPVPESVINVDFKVHKSLAKDKIFFKIKNEAVYYPLFESINLSSFLAIIKSFKSIEP